MRLLNLILIILCIEILLGILYFIITPKSIQKGKIIDYKSLIKGIVERLFIMISLLNNYPHSLTLFGALKLGTRLKRDNNENEKNEESNYNDFYLIGNFISVIIAILYVYLYNKFIT